MTMHMAAVNVCCDDSLGVLTEILSHECLCYLVSKFRSYIFGIGKAHDIVDSFHRTFPLQRFRAAELVFCKLLIDHTHLHIGLFGIGCAVYRSRVQHIFCLIGVQNVC